jgi:hypothetical protein
VKTPREIESLVRKFETKTGHQVHGAAQGDAAWHLMRLGVVTASNAHKAVAKKDSATRDTYMCELVAQVCTGISGDIDGVRALEWGKQTEDAARASYEFAMGTLVTQLPFVYMDETFREGCSPDGIVSLTKGCEIKCPFSTENYVRFLVADKLKPEWQWQTQFCMRVMDAECWDVVQYDPRMRVSPLKVLTVERDEEKQKAFADLVPAFIDDMDAMLKKIGFTFGDQWRIQ